MSLKERKIYEVYCDTCNTQLVAFGHHQFGSQTFANKNAKERGWTVGKGGGHWCGCFDPNKERGPS